MAFADIPPLPSEKEYQDLPFRKALKITPEKKLIPIDRAKKLAFLRSQAFVDSVRDQSMRVVKSFPSIDTMTEFYQELTKACIKEVRYRKDLATLVWITNNVNEQRKQMIKKMKGASTPGQANLLLKSFYGRSTSYLKRAAPAFSRLKEDRKIFMDFPALKTGLFTVCLVGFPNVGKSTLLAKITPAKPEIKDYAFTTKKLNLGYTTMHLQKIQVIDTPGTLNRFNKMNIIEKQAFLAMKYEADVLVWVFDPTFTYSLEKQWQMYETLKEFDKELLCFVSKTDITEEIPEQVKKLKPITKIKELRETIEKLSRE